MIVALCRAMSIGLLLSIPTSSLAKDLCEHELSKYIDGVRQSYDSVFSSPLYRRCRHATEQVFEAFTNQSTGRYHVPNDLLDRVADPERQALLDVVANYSEHCLPHPFETSNEVFSRFLLEVTSSLVLVSRRMDTLNHPICNGFLVGQHVVTARHCLLSTELQDSIRVEQKDVLCRASRIDAEQYRYWKIEGESEILELNLDFGNAVHPALYNGSEDYTCDRPTTSRLAEFRDDVGRADWIAVPLYSAARKQIGIEELFPSFDLKKEDAKFVFLGTNKFKLILESQEVQPISFPSYIMNSLSFDGGHICRPIIFDNGLFVHGCHSQDMSSGAPLIEYQLSWSPDGKPEIVWRLLGINTGSAAYEGVCGTLAPIGGGIDGSILNGGVRPQ